MNTRAVTANGIAYNVSRVAALQKNGFTLNYNDDKDVFVNGNVANDTSATSDEFAKRFAYNEVDTSGFPVLVYKQSNKLVAWYDEELAHGYIA